MQTIFARLNTRTARSFMIAFLCVGVSNISFAITPEQASEQVKNLPCKNNLTADQILDQSIKSHSQTDIGWHIFQEDGYFDVERAILVNKGMELHYRWRVQLDGSIAAENDRTISLCSAA